MPTGSTHNDKRASRRALPLLVSLVVGIAIGAAASWPLLFALDRQAPVVDEILRLMLPAFGVAAVLLLIAVPIAWWALSRFIKATGGTLQDVVREARQGVQAAANNDTAAAASHAEQAILEGLAWYGPLAARRFVVRTALGLLIAFGGMIGTALLFRQTVLLGVQNTLISEQVVLLSSQNAKIDLQTVTAEAQRRGVLSVELFSIMQEVAREIENVAKEQARPPYRLCRCSGRACLAVI
jgi:hypothetical protein